MGYYNINSKKLYVYTGNSEGIPMLYIHGAPGIGVVDFVKYQSDNLSEKYYLIAPEQRGVWRSQALETDEGFSINAVTDDYEELRKQLGIERWGVISHCMGARIALELYKKSPESISLMIFENPVLDSVTPFKEMIMLHLAMLKRTKYPLYKQLAEEVKQVCTPLALEDFCRKLEKATGLEANNIIMSHTTLKKLSEIKTDFDIDLFMRSRATEIKMSYCQKLYENADELVSNVKVPILVIHGTEDITVPKRTIRAIAERIHKLKIKEFYNCRHWVHLDNEQGYFQTVDDFIKQNMIFMKGMI